MESRRKQLQERIAAVQAEPRPIYGAELKREIAAYTEERLAEGATRRTVAEELNLSYGSLSAWVRHAALRHAAGRLAFERLSRRGTMPTKSNEQEASAHRPAQELWFVVPAEHVYLTTLQPEALEPWRDATKSLTRAR